MRGGGGGVDLLDDALVGTISAGPAGGGALSVSRAFRLKQDAVGRADVLK